MIHTSSRL